MQSLRVRIIAWDNGVGLARDARLLYDVLARAGHAASILSVESDHKGRRHRSARTWLLRRRDRIWALLAGHARFDVNVMVERIRPRFAAAARRNVLIPNPEWFKDCDVERFDEVDVVLAKTRHAESIFHRLGKPTLYLGFTGTDRLLPELPRERAFFHLAGRSEGKGTEALLALWRRHPGWPKLTVVQHPEKVRTPVVAPNVEHVPAYLSDHDLRVLQNRHVFHVCPSETEGFGHYLIEAMSVGAVTLTTDGPPMNEHVTPERGLLLPWSRTGTQRLATTYHVDEDGLRHGVERALALSDDACATLGRRAREWFVENDRAFRERAGSVLREATGPEHRGVRASRD